MITDKIEAIKEMKKARVDFAQFDRSLLQDKDVALAYMKHHSSNSMLAKDFPINVGVSGMVDDQDFIISLIKNLDVGYREDLLQSLIKYSTFRMIEGRVDNGADLDTAQLKEYATQILTTYNKMIKLRVNELSQKKSILEELDKFVNDAELDAFKNVDESHKRGNYKNCNMGFTAELK